MAKNWWLIVETITIKIALVRKQIQIRKIMEQIIEQFIIKE